MKELTFTAGPVDAIEAFGPTEGPVLLCLAGALILAVLVLLLLGRNLNRRSVEELDRIGSRLSEGGEDG